MTQASAKRPIPQSLSVLLHKLIDYAGLFPPAALDIKTALANYARYRCGEHAWMLGRFVLPAARLREFEQQLPAGEEQPWQLSVLVGPKLDDDTHAVEAFAPQCDRRAVIDCIETKVATVDDVSAAHGHIGTATTTYYEVPLGADLPKLLDAIKSVNGRAKIRTGGLTADAFPSTEAIANFLIECAKRDLTFKATAGLHHPLRCVKPFTYEKDSVSGVMHGFLNVFLAAASVFAWRKGVIATTNIAPHVRHILEMMTPSNFTDEWIGEPAQVPTSIVEEARREFATSFGSCSFEEPIADLRALNLL
jgi:hypothetical protein